MNQDTYPTPEHGEGFAYFRWHCIKHAASWECKGIADGLSSCLFQWNKLQRGTWYASL